jgi:putative endopeptidase
METEETKTVRFEDDVGIVERMGAMLLNSDHSPEEGVEMQDMLLLSEDTPKRQPCYARLWRRIREVGVKNLAILTVVLLSMGWFALSSYLVLLDAESVTAAYNYSAHATKVLSWMDWSAEPCDDFPRFAAGSALDMIELRDDQNSVNLAFGAAVRTVRSRIDEIIGEGWPYISTFYASCMDVEAIDARELAPIGASILHISTSSTVRRLLRTAANLRLDTGLDLELFFSTTIAKDVLNPERNVVSLSCRGGNLPDSSYYGDGDSVTAYIEWLGDAFAAVGLPLSDAEALKLVQLERRLNSHCYASDVYNLRSQTQLNTSLGSDVTFFLQTLGLLNNSETKLNLDAPAYYLQLQVILNTTELRTLQNYAYTSLFLETFSLLGRPFQALQLQYEQIYSDIGALEQRPLFCLRSTERSLGMLLSHYYIRSYFSAEARNRTSVMMQQLTQAYLAALRQDNWMDELTLSEAERKFTQLQVGVGYPDDWPDLDTLLQRSHSRLLSGQYFDNVLMLRRARDWSSLQHLGKPPIRENWDMLPIETNAYYSPESNRIVIPAGFIVEPLFEESGVPDAVNYCVLGAVLGHELGHAIDSSGSAFDADGRLIDWWTPASKNEFQLRVECIEDQYSTFEVAPGSMLNGELVSGEAMADLNGLTQALAALVTHRKLDPAATAISDKEILDEYGLTWKQLCFVSFAQMWAEKARTSYELQLSREDPHPMPRFRVEGTLQNMPAFASAFECPVGSRYNPAHKCELNKK